MKIHSIAVLISLPFVILIAYFGYRVFFMDDYNMFTYFFILVIIVTIIYVFQPQMDFAWYKKYPQTLQNIEKKFLNSISSFYIGLNDEEKEKFEKRVYVFMRAKDFKMIKVEKKELPQDMKLLIAANAVQLTLGLDDYLYEKYDNYFAYNHAFPTPSKQYLHSVEVNHEDHMAIFNMEILVNSQTVNNSIFNIGLFAFAEIFTEINSGIKFPKFSPSIIWNKVEEISKMSKESIVEHIGYEPPELNHVLIVLFFMYKESFKIVLPKEYSIFHDIFHSKIKLQHA